MMGKLEVIEDVTELTDEMLEELSNGREEDEEDE